LGRGDVGQVLKHGGMPTKTGDMASCGKERGEVKVRKRGGRRGQGFGVVDGGKKIRGRNSKRLGGAWGKGE